MGRRDRNNSRRAGNYFDYTLLFIILFLVGFGLIMLYSTSSYNAQIKFNDSGYYLKKQLFATVLGLGAMFLIAWLPVFDYYILTKFSFIIYGISIVCSILVYIVGQEYNGSKRWLKLGPISFQPSELAKLAIIIMLAHFISKIGKQMDKWKSKFIVLGIMLPPFVLVGANNLSSAIIIAGITAVLLFVASPRIKQLVLLAGIGCAGIALFLLTEGYRMERISVWLNPEEHDKGYQTLQALYAIGSGGIFGKGLGESMQKLGYVPEAQNDMIFSIICEELGLFGALCVILLFLLMLWRFMIIANNAPDLFGSLLVVGIMAHIAIQVILNIAVVTNTIPNTGITLPFISYGGTSVLFLLSEMGIALNVSRRIKLEKY